MTAPVTDDEIVQGCVKYLLAQPDTAAQLGTYADGTPWLFQDTLWTLVKGTQSQAAVVSNAGGWAGANLHNTLRFPRLSLEIIGDPMRDAGNNPVQPAELKRRLVAAYRVFDRLLHRPQGGVQMWGDIRTIASTRLGEYVILAVPDGEGMQRLQVFYAVTEG